MATRVAESAAERVSAPQEEVVVKAVRRMTAMTGEELGAELSGSYVKLPDDIGAQAHEWMENQKAALLERTELRLHALAADPMGRRVTPEAGEPTLASGYEYWDLLVLSPIQLIFPPFTFQPHKIVAAGELTFLAAVLFINPAAANGGPSATTVLGGRGFRIRFEQIDLTNVANGPDFTFIGTFPPIAPVISLFVVPFVPASPGPNPRLVELNVTADITDPGQPFAAFGSQWLDIEADPGFPVPRPGGIRNQQPLRYLQYPK